MGAKKITIGNKNLESFLRRKGVLKKYVKNCIEDNECYESHLSHPEIKIIESFVFDQTPEGFQFWQDLHDKFIKQLNK